VIFDNWDAVGGTGGFFLKAINPDTNQPLATLRGGTLFFYFAFLAITAAAYLLIGRLMASRWGYRWRGLHEDEEAARALGVPALRSKVFCVAVSAGLAGVGGGLFGLMQGSLFPDSVMGLRMSIEVLIAPIIGGLGSPFGPIVGAFFVVPLMEFSNVLGQRIGFYGLNTLIYGIVILGVIAFLPDGIWPRLVRLATFRKAGWNIDPATTGYITDGRYTLRINFDVSQHLTDMVWATHEYIGLLAYWMMGYTDSPWSK